MSESIQTAPENTSAQFFNSLDANIEQLGSGVFETGPEGREDSASLSDLSLRLQGTLRDGTNPALRKVVEAVDEQAVQWEQKQAEIPTMHPIVEGVEYFDRETRQFHRIELPEKNPRISLLLALRPQLRTPEERQTRLAEQETRRKEAREAFEHDHAPDLSRPESPQHTIVTPQGVVRGAILRDAAGGRPAEILTPQGVVQATHARLGNR